MSYSMIKRLFDFNLSLLFILLFFFPIVVISISIKLTSKGPVLFTSKRVGKDNRLFTMYKFRSLLITAPVVATHKLYNPNQYYTPIGLFLRRTSLDEIPQLFNIIKGEMSFVGPRPALYNQYDLIRLRNEKGVERLVPGLTGWAQINGRDELSIKSKVDYDFEYLRRSSFLFDLKIIVLTVFKVIKCDDILR